MEGELKQDGRRENVKKQKGKGIKTGKITEKERGKIIVKIEMIKIIKSMKDDKTTSYERN